MIEEILQWIKATPLSETISESDWWFPTIESAHVIALTLVVGSIAVVDLRLLNLASRARPARQVIASVLPITWSAFVVAAATGTLLFIAKPVVYAHNPFFLVKLALMALAGCNMALFHVFVQSRLSAEASSQGRLVKASGLASLILWSGVVVCGRWIGFSI
jgi:hypothetical protein